MVAGAHADAVAAEDLGDVVRVGDVERERDHRAAAVGVARAVERDARHLGQALERVGDEVALVGADGVHAQLGEEVDGGAQADALGDRRGAGLEALGRRGEARPPRSDTLEIMWPPPSHGGIASSSSRRPCRTPTPVGP